MTKRIEIGQLYSHKDEELVAGKSLSLDVDVFMRTRMLVQAASGQGKSHWLRRLAEQLTPIGIKVFVIDHEGEFATLRKGFDFFLAGKGGDLPIDVRTAAVTAHRMLEIGASCVFDLSETFRAHPRDRHTWVKNFIADGLMEAPQHLWRPVVVIVDEAHKYMPEKGESEALDAMISLASDGRKREFCAVYATQRLAKVSKDGAAELLNKLIGGTSLGLDRKRAGEEMGIEPAEIRAFNQEIKTIDRGFFWTLGPAISKDPVLVKIGDTITAPPARGSRAAVPPPPPAKVKAMLVELGDLAKVAEAKVQTEKDLRAKIVDLERQIRSDRATKVQPITATSAPAAAAPRKITAEELYEFIKPAFDVYVESLVAAIGDYQLRLTTTIQRTGFGKMPALDLKHVLSKAAIVFNKAAGSKAPASLERTSGRKGSPGLAQTVSERSTASVPRLPIDDRAEDVVARDGISRPMMLILKALADLEVIGQTKPSRSMVAFLSDASVTSSSFQKNLGALNTRRLITYPDRGHVALTTDGRREAPPAEHKSAEKVFADGLALLTNPQKQLLIALRDAYPETVARPDLAVRAGAAHSSSSFQKNLGSLKTAGLIEYPERGSAKAAEWLFF